YPIHYTLPTGCDSLINLRLIVQPAYVTAETLTLCDNELPLYYGDSVFMIGTLSGTYPVHYTLPGGCDSLVNLHLIVHPTYYDVDNVTICTSDLPLTYGDTVFYPGTSSGTYFISYLTSKGCDSVITLNLQVNQAYYFMDTVSLCDCDFPYTYMDTTFLEGTLDGDYVFNHTTSNGCDSIYSLTLYIHSTYSYTENATICAYDAYYWHGKTYNQTGVYYDSLKTKHSDCDSVFRLNLTVNDVYVTLDTITFCSNELPLEYQGKFIDRPGDYYISFTANNGCDSLVSLNVKLNQAYDTIVVAHVTKTKLPYVFGSQLLTDAGTYSELFKSVEFCDSLVHLVLVVGDLEKDTVYGNDSKKICASDLPYTYGSRIFPEGTKSGAYDIAFTTLEGKDSILNLYLTVLSIPSMPDSIIGLDKINVSGKYAYSVNPVEGADQYRWGISNSMFVFEDETNTSNNTVLYVALSGDAILSVAAGNQCGYSADKSMQILSSVSIADSYKDAFNVKIYPNPVQDNVYIDIEGENAIDEITLIDVYGKTVGRLPVSDSHLQWDVSALANGIYFLQFKAGKEIIGSYKIIRHK
ncbi:MAG: T9SS type A sorting domain-containing protein, partial [Bacteroidales bacterium]|nr:T9SS type A sorting domain-containing protein [Bacteroidales bacterium]